MKKILDSKFLFIVALSLVVLIILGVGAFYLFDDSDATFVKDGYVLNPLSAKSEKYFFDEATSYKENLSAMIEFKDTDNIDVTVLKDSFLHYMDGSLSFLKNGAILDLNSIEGTKAVDFYNITNKSMIEKMGNSYVIASKNGDVNLKNFIGRISDNKYIVVGALEAKIPGNTTNIKADYFEIVYTEEGVINIENKDNKFQVTADGTIIYVGDMTIDLGNKKITKNGEDVMSITAITIDGNENIEIIPKAEEVLEPSGDDSQGGEGAGEDGTDTADGNGDNQGEEGNTQDISIELKRANVGSTYASLSFDIKNKMADDTLNLTVTNLDTGRTVNKYENINTDEGINVSNLSPNTKYLFTLVNEKDDGKYYQKILETKDFGITFEKNYATDSSLAYTVTVGKDSDVVDATLSIQKYNEDTKQLEPVMSTYIDEDGNEVVHEKTIKLSDLGNKIIGTHEVIFDELDSNTVYTAVLNNITVGGAGNGKAYEMSKTDLTLKKAPVFSGLNPVKGVDNNSFKLAIEGIEDVDNAIVSYTYYIYERGDTEKTAIAPIVKSDASPIEVLFGNGENRLKNDDDGTHKYFYRVVIKYFDNEKNIEFVTGDSITFSMGIEPYITVVPNSEKISYNSIGGSIYLIDNSCTIPMPGREGCDDNSTARVIIGYDGQYGKSTYLRLDEKECHFTVMENEIKCDFYLEGLVAGTKYYIDVEAMQKDENGEEVLTEILHTSESTKSITTKSLSTFTVDWNLNKSQMESSASHVIYIDPKLIANENSGTLSPQETAAAIKKIKIELYEGNDVIAVENRDIEPIATAVINNRDIDIKENFYDERYLITSDGTFGLTLDDDGYLVNQDGKIFELQENYTLAVFAYYDGDKNISLTNYITPYRVSPALFMNELEEPKVILDQIKNSDSEISHTMVTNNLNNDGTVVGYNVLVTYDRQGLLDGEMTPTRMHLFVYDESGKQVNFYRRNGNDLEIVEGEYDIPTTESGFFETEIYMSYGLDYGEDDNFMRRGQTYYVGFYLDVDTKGGSVKYPSSKAVKFNNGIGAYSEGKTVEKEMPKITMYVASSTKNSITYKYDIKDPDKSIYKPSDSDEYSLYYTVEDDEEEKSIPITPNVNSFNNFVGDDLTLKGLRNDIIYRLYYKRNATVTGNADEDIKPYYVADSENGRIFDGYYDAKDYNFKYEVINNPETDNKVTIKILASLGVLDRIVNYHVTLTDTKGNVYETNLWNLQTCSDGSNRCFTIDYSEFKNMKSDNNKKNDITVSVSAYYDNGLTGFDFEVGNDKEYKYMIFQNNNADSEYGKYITYSTRGQITNWSSDINVPKGYYNYSFKDTDRNGFVDKINYKSMLNTSHNIDLKYFLSDKGYEADGASIGTLNPKMVAVAEMQSLNNTFSFYSITPKISINKTTRIINGAVVNMGLTGIADIEDFCDESNLTTCINNTDSDKYLYIETWATEADAEEDLNFSKTVRPTVKVKINKNSPKETMNAKIDELANDSRYYYRVYTYLNKDSRNVYTQLFDSSSSTTNETRTYSFMSLSSGDIFKDLAIDYLISKDEGAGYNDKKLQTTINLEKYQNGEPFNFEVKYALCSVLAEGEEDNCGINDDNTNIFVSSISQSRIIDTFLETDKVNDAVDITEYLDDFEFDKDYRVYIYALFDYYDIDSQKVVKRPLLLNRRNNTRHLRELKKPEITATRKAGYDDINLQYVIDFEITIKDPDRALNNGEYYIKLSDEGKNNVVGNLQVKEDGNWKTVGADGLYNSYKLYATDINKNVRIGGLTTPDTPYTVTISGKSFLNNYSESISKEWRTVDIEKTYVVYTSNELGVAFGSVSYAPTSNSLVLTFIGGSNLYDHICDVEYTIGRWENAQNTWTFSGNYEVPNDKTFEYYTESDNWRFLIDGGGLQFAEGPTYNAKVIMKVCDPETGVELDSYTFEKTDITYAKEIQK